MLRVHFTFLKNADVFLKYLWAFEIGKILSQQVIEQQWIEGRCSLLTYLIEFCRNFEIDGSCIDNFLSIWL